MAADWVEQKVEKMAAMMVGWWAALKALWKVDPKVGWMVDSRAVQRDLLMVEWKAASLVVH